MDKEITIHVILEINYYNKVFKEIKYKTCIYEEDMNLCTYEKHHKQNHLFLSSMNRIEICLRKTN